MGMLDETTCARNCAPDNRHYTRSILVLTIAVCILLLANIFILVVLNRVERNAAGETIHASCIAEEGFAEAAATAAARPAAVIERDGTRYTRRVDIVGAGDDRSVSVSVRWRTLAGERCLHLQRPVRGETGARACSAAAAGIVNASVLSCDAGMNQSSSLTLKSERSE